MIGWSLLNNNITIAIALGIPVRIPAKNRVLFVSCPFIEAKILRKNRLKPNWSEFCIPYPMSGEKVPY